MNIRLTILAASLILDSLPATAEDLLINTNNANGIMVITDHECGRSQGLVTKSTDARGNILLTGCTIPVKGSWWKIHWKDGEETYIKIDDWQQTNAFDAWLERQE